MATFKEKNQHGKSYEVTVTDGRRGPAVATFTIFARDPKQAKKEAILQAGDKDSYDAQVRRS